MTNDAKELERKIAEIRASFSGKLNTKLADIKRAQHNLDNAKSVSEAETALNELNMLTHTLAGSAATFGFPDISKISIEFEMMTEQLEPSETDQPVSENQHKKLIELTDQ
jgi:HPt (histidine-containing phosphotransfer) domain-containing protein